MKQTTTFTLKLTKSTRTHNVKKTSWKKNSKD